ncbi:hypothetical protein D3C71_259010 [compost metagenome]
MPYLVYFQIGATLTSFALMGAEKLHHVSGPAMLVISLLGGGALVGVLKFIESR